MFEAAREEFETCLTVLLGLEKLKATEHRGGIVSLGGHKKKVLSVADTGDTLKDNWPTVEQMVAIFDPSSYTHDLGTVILGGRILGVHCQFPMPKFNKNWDDATKKLGSRHRAAMGMSAATGAEVFVLSEETGRISIARHGKLFELPLLLP